MIYMLSTLLICYNTENKKKSHKLCNKIISKYLDGYLN